MMNPENNILTIKTVQIQPIRNLFASIKEVVTDVTMTMDRDGVKMYNFDKSHTILVNVVLDANKFEYYNCKPQNILLCCNALHIFKLISTLSNDDVLTIYIEKSDYNDGIVSHLSFQYENKEIKQFYVQKLKLLEVEDIEMQMPGTMHYDSIVTLPSSDFQKIIRDCNAISERVEIKMAGNQLSFSCEGSFASANIFRSENDGCMDFLQKPHEAVVIQGMFSLKTLSNFIKCTGLSTYVELYLANTQPLCVCYSVASLGNIKLCLASLPTF